MLQRLLWVSSTELQLNKDSCRGEYNIERLTPNTNEAQHETINFTQTGLVGTDQVLYQLTNFYSATIIFYFDFVSLIFITFNVFIITTRLLFLYILLKFSHFNLILSYDTCLQFTILRLYAAVLLFNKWQSASRSFDIKINRHIYRANKMKLSHRNRQQNSMSSKMLTQGGHSSPH